MGAEEKFTSLQNELNEKEDQASFLVSRGTIQALLYAQQDLKRLQDEHKNLKSRRLKLNVNLMKSYKREVADQRRQIKEDARAKRRKIMRDLRQAEIRIQQLEQQQETQLHIPDLMAACNLDVIRERIRQNELWGHQRHDMQTWLMILMEEAGEVAQGIQQSMGWGKPTDTPADALYKEWIQVSAVALSAAEQLREEAHHGEVEPITKIGYSGTD